jgi:hypothetical protein
MHLATILRAARADQQSGALPILEVRGVSGPFATIKTPPSA